MIMNFIFVIQILPNKYIEDVTTTKITQLYFELLTKTAKISEN